MEIGETLYVTTPGQWREWIRKNHRRKKEIWLVYYLRQSGKPRIAHHDAVDEALCFGWIDSTAKKIDVQRFAQRFSPRRKGSPVSELNKARIRRLMKEKKMTKAGLDALSGEKDLHKPKKLRLAADIERALKEDSNAWKHFQKFPESYKRIRVGYLEASRHRPEFFNKRLKYFIKMTAQNKMFGIMRE